MSIERQPDRVEESFRVRSLAVTYRDGHRIERHSHSWAQLIYAASGTMRVSTETATWLVPPTRAIWAPAGVEHDIVMRGETAIRTLYVAPDTIVPESGRPLAAECRAIEVVPLLRELILHIVAQGALSAAQPADVRLCGVLLDLLGRSESAPLGLPMPADRRARRVAERLLQEAGDRARLAELARDVGASVRTLQRLFSTETGLSIEAWRLRARLQQAVAMLASGATVSAAALATGYGSASAFIATFRKTFGVTPAHYRRVAITGKSR